MKLHVDNITMATIRGLTRGDGCWWLRARYRRLLWSPVIRDKRAPLSSPGCNNYKRNVELYFNIYSDAIGVLGPTNGLSNRNAIAQSSHFRHRRPSFSDASGAREEKPATENLSHPAELAETFFIWDIIAIISENHRCKPVDLVANSRSISKPFSCSFTTATTVAATASTELMRNVFIIRSVRELC
ncbi:hypothetical protein ACI65C_003163 [Semiaphis heraclei]